jgi:periplasmic mercuric ion binding protein
MKTLRLFSILSFFLIASQFSFAQNATTETISVSGNCGMCKSNIEKAAKKAGATKAAWDMDEKKLTVTYNSSSTNAAKIQQAIAAVGYDTRDVKTTDEAYNKLHACCKYERTSGTNKVACCDHEKCSKGHECCAKGEMKDGKCTASAACKESGCCTNGTCTKKS